MKKTALLLLLLSLAFYISADFSVSSYDLDFGSCSKNQNVNRTITITNTSETSSQFNLFIEGANFSIDSQSVSIDAGGYHDFTISFSGVQNITYNGFIAVRKENELRTKIIELTAEVHYAGYSTTFDLWDDALESALSTIVNGYNTIGYIPAKEEMFGYIDNENGQVMGVYTGQYYTIPVGGMPNQNTFNCEHTWPQSKFDGNTPKEDLHHLYPTYATVNSRRGNYPFGEVVNQTWTQGGSKMGTNSSGATVFEPRDPHKGNCARSMFYFTVQYYNPYDFLDSQETILRQWNIQDPVDTAELTRTGEIEDVQGNRNPFVDNPEFVERIQSFTTNATHTFSPEVYCPVTQYPLSTNQTRVAIANSGMATLNITGINLPDDIDYDTYDNTLEPGESTTIPVYALTTVTAEQTMTVHTNAGDVTIQLVPMTVDIKDETKEVVSGISCMVYPQPFSFASGNNIKFSIKSGSDSPVSLEIFNIKGQKVYNESYTRPGNVVWNGKTVYGKSVSTGVYFVRMKQNDTETVKKLVILQ